jgi:NAD(P)-dependent dehydrogenase (short-subunit alcohol dehydrogenase family)
MLRTSTHLSHNLDKLQPFRLDFTRLVNVQRMGLDIMKLEKLKRLGILINTADAPPGPLDIDNATGVSTQMLVNHLGPMLFTITLLPLLKTTDKANNTPVDKKDVRIVYVNSTAFLDAPQHCQFKDNTDYNKTFPNDKNGEEYVRYAYTKLADLLFCMRLQQLLEGGEGSIIVTCPHSGAVATAGAEDSQPGDESLSPLDDAMTPLWCAAHSFVWTHEHMYKGSFVMPDGETKTQISRDRDANLSYELARTSSGILKDCLKVLRHREGKVPLRVRPRRSKSVA